MHSFIYAPSVHAPHSGPWVEGAYFAFGAVVQTRALPARRPPPAQRHAYATLALSPAQRLGEPWMEGAFFWRLAFESPRGGWHHAHPTAITARALSF